eukprot:9011837-Alexandrium_andersonii.AAC.1
MAGYKLNCNDSPDYGLPDCGFKRAKWRGTPRARPCRMEVQPLKSAGYGLQIARGLRTAAGFGSQPDGRSMGHSRTP